MSDVDGEGATSHGCQDVHQRLPKPNIDIARWQGEGLRRDHLIRVECCGTAGERYFNGVTKFGQVDGQPIPEQLPHHEPHRNSPRKVAVGMSVPFVCPAYMGEVPSFHFPLSGNQWGLTRRTDTAAGQALLNLVHINDPTVYLAQCERDQGVVHGGCLVGEL
ncbi:hypothetical protein RKE25_10925 [Dyella sp. BiH032]|uniref:hypothetical protein n=1 Tax=Dyella sp. BiH032 TaxID=3075430 RepID=UPI002892AF59|nr:hypothetical protein [Dyella sp. BiH032]WNL48104.1 hypothetical protein RKE25_10925 [Dyella sp. BiH032]